jgi:hypothetical protein
MQTFDEFLGSGGSGSLLTERLRHEAKTLLDFEEIDLISWSQFPIVVNDIIQSFYIGEIFLYKRKDPLEEKRFHYGDFIELDGVTYKRIHVYDSRLNNRLSILKVLRKFQDLIEGNTDYTKSTFGKNCIVRITKEKVELSNL